MKNTSNDIAECKQLVARATSAVSSEYDIRGKLTGDLLLGRVSFLFSGALFSAIFFRHLPQLDFLPPFGQALVKILCVAGILFSFFCYSLELERLGKAIGEPPQKS